MALVIIQKVKKKDRDKQTYSLYGTHEAQLQITGKVVIGVRAKERNNRVDVLAADECFWKEEPGMHASAR